MKVFFDDEEFDGQLQRAVGKAFEGCADVGECFADVRAADRERGLRQLVRRVVGHGRAAP